MLTEHLQHQLTSTVGLRGPPSLLRWVDAGPWPGPLPGASGRGATRLVLLKSFSTRCFVRALLAGSDLFNAWTDRRDQQTGRAHLLVPGSELRGSRCQDATEAEQSPRYRGHVAAAHRSVSSPGLWRCTYLCGLVHLGVHNTEVQGERGGRSGRRSGQVTAATGACTSP